MDLILMGVLENLCKSKSGASYAGAAKSGLPAANAAEAKVDVWRKQRRFIIISPVIVSNFRSRRGTLSETGRNPQCVFYGYSFPFSASGRMSLARAMRLRRKSIGADSHIDTLQW